MVRTWTPRVYDLSRERVGELQRFCWQYREKKARIAAMRGGANGTTLDGMPHGQGGVGRPTEQRALDVVEGRDARDVQMIEECAMAAADGGEVLYTCLIANVCDRIAYNHLNMPPQGINQFSATKRRFFWLLDKKR